MHRDQFHLAISKIASRIPVLDILLAGQYQPSHKPSHCRDEFRLAKQADIRDFSLSGRKLTRPLFEFEPSENSLF